MGAYVEHKTMAGEHGDTVNTVAFSPCGKYLASGSSDHSICIWDVRDGSLLYRIVFKSSVNTLVWHPSQENTLVCGCDDGSLLSMTGFKPDGFASQRIRLGVKAPVFCMDIDPNAKMLAIGIGNQVHITPDDFAKEYTTSTKLPSPPQVEVSGEQIDSRIRPRSIHFIGGAKTLIVSYFNHGIVAWNIGEKMTIAWHLKPPGIPQIGCSAICPELGILVVNTLKDGPHLYKLGSQQVIRKWNYNTQPNMQYRLSASFLHNGQAIVSGTSTGNVCIWNTASEELYQVLPHDGDVIQAVAAHQDGPWSYIAVGSAFKGQDTYLKIWKANINPSMDVVDVFWNRLIVLRFSMDRSDYGHVALAVLFTILCALLASGLLQLIWAFTPWEGIHSFIWWLIQYTADLLVSIASLTSLAGQGLLRTAKDYIRTRTIMLIRHLKLALRSFLELPPADVYTLPVENVWRPNQESGGYMESQTIGGL
ncbi:hypothetical protein M404DRAFT_1008795 [Pisolithus tinctorius Marx 270]|uniref:Uncharacterized protein n=1 Tax=Pisolithus tinctorius Marx 270 TaxID=870435 RepID=A0A0C3NCR2_PISTI|nr:hypothetical protein M404DRAFT_1008795 [Pisolithus tinctorius Marx 270]